jgi:hypothetical protein
MGGDSNVLRLVFRRDAPEDVCSDDEHFANENPDAKVRRSWLRVMKAIDLTPTKDDLLYFHTFWAINEEANASRAARRQ